MSYHREKIVNVSLILLSAQNPWKALEVEDIGLKENKVLLYFKTDSSQEHRDEKAYVMCNSYKAVTPSIFEDSSYVASPLALCSLPFERTRNS